MNRRAIEIGSDDKERELRTGSGLAQLAKPHHGSKHVDMLCLCPVCRRWPAIRCCLCCLRSSDTACVLCFDLGNELLSSHEIRGHGGGIVDDVFHVERDQRLAHDARRMTGTTPNVGNDSPLSDVDLSVVDDRQRFEFIHDRIKLRFVIWTKLLITEEASRRDSLHSSCA